MEWYDNICYWYREDHDMGATIPYCSKYDSYAEGKYGERPRNCHDKNCESYISKTDVKNLVINYQMLGKSGLLVGADWKRGII